MDGEVVAALAERRVRRVFPRRPNRGRPREARGAIHPHERPTGRRWSRHLGNRPQFSPGRRPRHRHSVVRLAREHRPLARLVPRVLSERAAARRELKPAVEVRIGGEAAGVWLLTSSVQSGEPPARRAAVSGAKRRLAMRTHAIAARCCAGRSGQPTRVQSGARLRTTGAATT